MNIFIFLIFLGRMVPNDMPGTPIHRVALPFACKLLFQGLRFGKD